MKRIILIIAVVIIFTNQIFAISVISGTWNRPLKDGSVSLYEVENGKLKPLASSTLNAKKEFAFALNISKPGFYVVGISPQSPMHNYTFYLKPNDNLNIEVNASSYTLIGENTPENKELTRWHDLIEPLESKSIYFMGQNSTYVDFFPLFEEKLGEIEAFKSNITDTEFNKVFKDYRRFDLLKIALYFVQTPRSAHPKGEDFPDYYGNVKLNDLSSTDAILSYPYGTTLLRMARFLTASRLAENVTDEERKKIYDTYASLDRDLPNLINAEVKGEVVLQQSKSIQTYEGLIEFQNKYAKYLSTEEQKKEFKELLMSKASNSEGQDAFNFKFKDVNNKEISLSDFKGKLVYVDVWATWCGPCKKEIPSLKKIEAEYANKDIVFLGVSIDEQKSYDKWKEFLVTENLPGVQVFAGDQKEDITKPYKIAGIPRFMLFGKDGKIITIDAPRPSSNEIRSLLDAKLK